MAVEPIVDKNYPGVAVDEARHKAAEILAAAGLKVLAFELTDGCLKVNPDEPFFVLRAQDVSAPSVVEYWALQNNAHTPAWKIEEAHRVADRMRRYSGPKKDPD